MSKEGIWNLREIARQNPISPGEFIKRTPIAEGKHSTVLLVQANPQKSPFLHIHNHHDELVFILEGEGEFIVGDITKQVKPGDLIYAPMGTVHGPNVPVGGIRLAIYMPYFDINNPDRIVVGSKEA